MRKKKTTAEFIEQAKEAHGDKYDYSRTIYKNALNKVIIICKNHGQFKQNPSKHINEKQGCPKCAIEIKAQGAARTLIQFISDASKQHLNEYDYSLISNYKNGEDTVKIICKKHGVFKQKARKHLEGSGCSKCANEKITKTKAKFIKDANKVHKNKYNYDCSIYINNHIPIIIMCEKHGEFKQTPAHHLSGQRCPCCANSNISKASIKWLDKLKVPKREYKIKIKGKNYFADGYDPKTNTIYEYLGGFWHGDPSKYWEKDMNPRNKKTYGELFDEIFQRIIEFKSAGYKIIWKWE